jgi:limonene-1,2-epoxide hydrolase
MLRRELLGIAGGVAALLACTSSADAQSDDAANIRIVTDFCNAFTARDPTKVSPFLDDAIVYRVSETSAPITGRDAVLARIKTFFDGVDSVEFRISRSYCIGPIVINERVDTFEGPNKHWRFHLTGMFYVKDRRIKEWTDFLIRDS